MDAITVTLSYPRSSPIKAVEINLEDVRASDGLRIEYDFDRDGWIIMQPKRLSWAAGESVDCQWTEVAFVESWAVNEDANER